MRNYPYEHAPRLPDVDTIDPRALLGVEEPVELEIGPGRGWFMVERVENDATAHILGLEVKLKWATIVDERLKQRGFGDRARVFAEDVAAVLPRFAPASLSRVYVHFPDPWWKKRHQKRLVVRDEVISEVVRTLVPGGELFVQTDVEERADAYQRLLDAVPQLVAVEGGPRVADNPFGARSPRERKAIEDELPVFRLLYSRVCDQ